MRGPWRCGGLRLLLFAVLTIVYAEVSALNLVDSDDSWQGMVVAVRIEHRVEASWNSSERAPSTLTSAPPTMSVRLVELFDAHGTLIPIADVVRSNTSLDLQGGNSSQCTASTRAASQPLSSTSSVAWSVAAADRDVFTAINNASSTHPCIAVRHEAVVNQSNVSNYTSVVSLTFALDNPEKHTLQRIVIHTPLGDGNRAGEGAGGGLAGASIQLLNSEGSVIRGNRHQAAADGREGEEASPPFFPPQDTLDAGVVHVRSVFATSPPPARFMRAILGKASPTIAFGFVELQAFSAANESNVALGKHVRQSSIHVEDDDDDDASSGPAGCVDGVLNSQDTARCSTAVGQDADSPPSWIEVDFGETVCLRAVMAFHAWYTDSNRRAVLGSSLVLLAPDRVPVASFNPTGNTHAVLHHLIPVEAALPLAQRVDLHCGMRRNIEISDMMATNAVTGANALRGGTASMSTTYSRYRAVRAIDHSHSSFCHSYGDAGWWQGTAPAPFCPGRLVVYPRGGYPRRSETCVVTLRSLSGMPIASAALKGARVAMNVTFASLGPSGEFAWNGSLACTDASGRTADAVSWRNYRAAVAAMAPPLILRRPNVSHVYAQNLEFDHDSGNATDRPDVQLRCGAFSPPRRAARGRTASASHSTSRSRPPPATTSKQQSVTVARNSRTAARSPSNTKAETQTVSQLSDRAHPGRLLGTPSPTVSASLLVVPDEVKARSSATATRFLSTVDRVPIVDRPDQVTTAVASTGVVAVSATRFIGPGAASRVGRVYSASAAMRCGAGGTPIVEHGYVTYPLQFRWKLDVNRRTTTGNDDDEEAAEAIERCNGGTLLSVLLVGVTSAANFVLYLWMPRCSRGVQSALGVASAVSLAYFGPAFTGSAVFVIQHGYGTQHGLLHVGSAAVAVVLLAMTLHVVHRDFEAHIDVDDRECVSSVNGQTVVKQFVANASIERPFMEAFGALFDAARDVRVPVVRALYVEEVAMSMALSIAGYIDVESRVSCAAASVAAVALGLGHIGYLGFFRPYRTRIEAGFAMLIGVAQVCTATVALALHLSHSAGVNDASKAHSAGEIATQTQAVCVLLQPVAVVVWMAVRYVRQRVHPSAHPPQSGSRAKLEASDHPTTGRDLPLLRVPSPSHDRPDWSTPPLRRDSTEEPIQARRPGLHRGERDRASRRGTPHHSATSTPQGERMDDTRWGVRTHSPSSDDRGSGRDDGNAPPSKARLNPLRTTIHGNS